MMIVLYCAVTSLCIGGDKTPPMHNEALVHKTAKSAPGKLPYPFPGVSVVNLTMAFADKSADGAVTTTKLVIDLPTFWKKLSANEQKNIKTVPQLINLAQRRFGDPKAKVVPPAKTT